MNLLSIDRIDPPLLKEAGEGPYLCGWYPGFGEEWILSRFPARLQGILADAAEEYPPLVEGYLLPTLGDPLPYDRIMSDLSCALSAAECESRGMGSYEDLLDDGAGLGEMGNLGKSFLKKVAKTIRKVHQQIEKKIVPKPLRKLEEKVHKIATKTGQKIEKAGGKILSKYGNLIITAAGAVLAPFTGGASLAAAAALTAANTAYQKRAAARKAKAAGKKEATALTQQADQADAALLAQVNQFYQDNQAWFQERGITPAQWAGMTLQQKIDAINAGASGPAPSPGPSPMPGSQPMPGPSGGGSSMPMPSGGGGGGGGGGSGEDWSLPGGGSSGSGTSAGGQKAAQASMFGGDMLLPALAIGALVVMSGGGKGKRSSRPRRNPRRRQPRRRW